MTARMSAAKARAVIDAATLIKASDWRETRHWHVVSGGTALVTVAPAYSGTRRTGWRYWLTQYGPSNTGGVYATKDAAAVAGLGAWERSATRR